VTIVDDTHKTVTVMHWRVQVEATGARIGALDHPVVVQAARLRFRRCLLLEHVPQRAKVCTVIFMLVTLSLWFTSFLRLQHTCRDVTIVDETRKTVTVTLWREQAEATGARLEALVHPVVVLTKLRVSDFGGVSLSSTYHTTVEIDPEGVAEAAALREWWASAGSSQTFAPAGDAPARVGGSRSKWCPLESLAVEREGASEDDKPEYASLQCVLALVPEEQTLYYEANTANNKKVRSVR
jgi:hypothetical protein